MVWLLYGESRSRILLWYLMQREHWWLRPAKLKNSSLTNTYTMASFSQCRWPRLVSQSVCSVNNVCVGECVTQSMCDGVGGGVVKILLTSSVTLPLSLSLSSRQHNPCMTLNSWLTAPPSRLFHPTTEQHGPSAPAPFLTVSPAECSVKTEVLYHANYEKTENFMFCFYCFFLV